MVVELALLKVDTIVLQTKTGRQFGLPNGDVVSPAYDGWSSGEYRLEAIQPADPIPAGYRSTGQTVEFVAGLPKFIDQLVEITAQERREAMPPLVRWRLNTIIDLEVGLRDKINAAIAEMPDPARTIARNKLADVLDFVRVDSLLDQLGAHPTIGKTPEDIDVMWMAGHALPS